MIVGLFEDVERLKEILNQDSKTTSKPPSSDLLQRSEQAKVLPEGEKVKRKPGLQVGLAGKTRKGFGQIVPTTNSCDPKRVLIAKASRLKHRWKGWAISK